MSLKDPNWKYQSAEQSRKPGYLSRRFAQYRKQQAEAKRAQDEVVAKRVIGSKK